MKSNGILFLCAICLTSVGCVMNSEPESSPEDTVDEASEAISTVAISDRVVDEQGAADPGASVVLNDVTKTTESAELVAPTKKAMTWSLLNWATSSGKAYAVPGSDASTNPYQGDTYTSNMLPVLCINKNNPPYPGAGVIGNPVQTPGGAWRRTWSGGTIAVTAPVQGTSLTSLAVANALCAGQFGAGYRMAEFHDGDPTVWSGWDFWAQVLGANIGPFQGTRFWVYINGQNANPW